MTDSPPSRYILVRGDKNLVVRTQPFYSVFFQTEPRRDTNLFAQIRQKANRTSSRNKNKSGTRSCVSILRGEDPVVGATDDIPFGVGSEAAVRNLTLFAAVFIVVVVMGVLAFSYWVRAMGSGDPVLRDRSVYLSVFFIAAAGLLSVMSYELFTLKKIFRPTTGFHSFLLGGRRIVIWVFLLMWLAVVAYTTAILSQRPEAFREQIVVNVVAGVVLLVSQYLYHRASSPAIQTFSLLMSVLVVGFLVVLIYGA